jgi:hypothetical protein
VRITIDIPIKKGLTFFEELNRDDGMRERAVDRMMSRSDPEWVSRKTDVIEVLGMLSKAFREALQETNRLNTAKRAQELYRLAFPNKEEK